jgi:hypothetical protein
MPAILRPNRVHGVGNPLPVGATKFDADYVWHSESDPYVPGTNIPRLRPVQLGERAKGFFDDEVAALVEALRLLRDASPPKMRPPKTVVARRQKKARRANRRSEAA